MFHHHPTTVEDPLPGFGCHKILRVAAGRYDYFGHLEDDVVLISGVASLARLVPCGEAILAPK